MSELRTTTLLAVAFMRCAASLCLACALLAVTHARGDVLHVPAAYPDIQTALSATAAWDTVLVDPGVYHEFLNSPDHPFTLSGLFPADTSELLRTILDPIPSAGPDTPSVFMITGDTVSISNIVFRNRPELRQYNGAYTRSGALRNYSSLLRVENCRFDSVSRAIWGGNRIIVSAAKFVGCSGECIIPQVLGSVEAEGYEFESGGFSLITAYSGSRFSNCHFRCNTSRIHYLNLFGSNILVESCIFGPCESGSPTLYVYAVQNVAIEGCTFEGLQNVSQIISLQAECAASHATERPLVVRQCLFHNYRVIPPRAGGTAIDCQCLPNSSGWSARIEECRFVEGGNDTTNAAGVQAWSSIELNGCVFDSLFPPFSPDVRAVRTDLDTIIARHNSFLPPGTAARSAGSYFDARQNWWGDATGPFHESENPNGQGSEVGNGILFDPWLLQSPDSVDSGNVVESYPSEFHPESFQLTASPNPFNASTTLLVDVTRPGEYRILLYGVTGRLVAELFRGRIQVQERVRVDAGNFGSGIYFASLLSSERTLAVSKLLFLK